MIRSIEGLRGLAALLVALFHAYVYGKWGGQPAGWGVLQHAWLFVDLFFVISGFVMAAAYADRLQTPAMLGSYLVRRFFRLYPLHIVTTVAVILAALGVQTAKWLLARHGVVLGGAAPFAVPFFDPGYFGLEVLLLQGVGILQMEIHNYPAWSISVEFWMYLVFGLVMMLVRTRWLRVAFSLAMVALCVAYFLRIWSSLAPAGVTLDVQGLPRGLLSFFLGVLSCHAWQWIGAGRARAAPTAPTASVASVAPTSDGRAALGIAQVAALGLAQVAAVGLALFLVGRQDQLGAAQLAIPFAFAGLLLTLLPDRGLIARWLQTRPMQWLGLHSYAIYLTHITVYTVLDWPGRVIPEPAKHLVGLLFVAVVLALSALCYRHIEVPWRERGKRIARRLEHGWAGRRTPAANPRATGAPFA
ncbi:MAG: acyltransferase [Lautropia sp.]